MDQAITRAAGATQIASPLPAAAVRRQWTLLLTSANHGVVGPLGSTFTHAGERFERVDVVEVPAAAGAPVDQVNLQVVRTAVPARPVGEFQGYVGGQPSVQWFDRTRMPNVGEKLYAGTAPVAGGSHALTEKQIDHAWDSLPSTFTRGQGEQEWNRENRHAFARAIEREVAAQAGQVAVPEGFVLMPRRLTAENGAKGLLSGEFSGSCSVVCPSCDGSGEVDYDIDCGECSGEGTVEQRVPVEWDTIKRIYDMAVEHLAAAPSAPAVAQEAPADWISVDDTEPPEHELIAVRYSPYDNHENAQAVTGGRYIDGTFYNDEGNELHPPSHWCRLPQFDEEATAQASTAGERQEGGDRG